jgi:hypothetical protein
MCRSYIYQSSTSSSIRTTVTSLEAIHTKAQRPPPGEPTPAARVAIISNDSSPFHSAPTSAFQDADTYEVVTTNHTSDTEALVDTPCDSIAPPTPTVHVHWTSADDSTASSACSLTGVSRRRLLIPCYCVTPRPYDVIAHPQASPPPPPRAHYSVIQIGEIPDRLLLPLL